MGKVYFCKSLKMDCAQDGSSDSSPSLHTFNNLSVTALLLSGWSTGQQVTLRLAVDCSMNFTSCGQSALAFLSPSVKTNTQHTQSLVPFFWVTGYLRLVLVEI